MDDIMHRKHENEVPEGALVAFVSYKILKNWVQKQHKKQADTSQIVIVVDF